MTSTLHRWSSDWIVSTAPAAMRGWTRRLLAAIEESPGLRSGDLAERLGDEQVRLKRRVRRLKDLGLTESLGIGYRLSPRGQAVTERLMGG
ncbi:hypothetical protein BH24ACT14_BH24ACT14_07980 [soil metagenome]